MAEEVTGEVKLVQGKSDNLNPISGGDCDVQLQSGTSDSPQSESGIESPADGALKSDVPVAEDAPESEKLPETTVNIKYQKQTYPITLSASCTIEELKMKLHKIVLEKEGRTLSKQKLMYKGELKDDATIASYSLTPTTKIMCIATTESAIAGITGNLDKPLGDLDNLTSKKPPPIWETAPHDKIIKRYGRPNDLMIGWCNGDEPAIGVNFTGLYNQRGQNVRLIFKLEADEVCLSTREKTTRLNMNRQISRLIAEPMTPEGDYYLLGFQTGNTELSAYWVYWMPAQYVKSIKAIIK